MPRGDCSGSCVGNRLSPSGSHSWQVDPWPVRYPGLLHAVSGAHFFSLPPILLIILQWLHCLQHTNDLPWWGGPQDCPLLACVLIPEARSCLWDSLPLLPAPSMGLPALMLPDCACNVSSHVILPLAGM